ncbi:hypothetical protein MPSEU_000207900 [Mayamaea pseudoterrestris]|nr:hypothetical protein MPSEU_000207900 [Mayamaea pseudoterrestris]
MPSIKGTSSVSSTRALEKALKRTKFPACFSQRVDLAKINRPVLTQWIENKIDELLGFEDEIVQSTAVNLFLPVAPEDSSMQPAVDPRTAQLDLAGFLSEEGSATFAEELWQLMLDAQEQAMGIPRKIVEEKKKELELQQQLADAAKVHLPPIRPPHAAPPRQFNQYNQQRPQVRPVSPPRHYNDGDWRRDDVGRDHHHEAPVPLNDQGHSKSDEFGRSIPVPQPPLRTEARGSSSHRDDSRRRGDSRVHREGRRDDDSDRRRRDYRHDDRRGEASRRRHRSRSSSPGRNRHVRRRQSHSSSASSSTSSSASYSSTSSSGSSSRSRGGSRGR